MKRLKIKMAITGNGAASKEQVADMLMCDQSLYSKYERGEREIPLSLLIMLADFYETSLDYLTYRVNKK